MVVDKFVGKAVGKAVGRWAAHAAQGLLDIHQCHKLVPLVEELRTRTPAEEV